MEAPEEVWGSEGPPPVPPALFAVMFLVMLYFTVYLSLAISTTVNESGCLGPPTRFGVVQEALKSATTTVSSASMLCILFLAARMRANQLGVEPQLWAKWCFFICAFSVLAQTLLALVEGLVKAKLENSESIIPKVIQGVWTFFLFCMYVAIVGIFVSVFLLKDRDGNTVEVSPTVFNVIFLCAVYFTIYLLTWILSSLERMRMKAEETVEQHSGVKHFLTVRAKDAVDFCPMVCVLFVGTRLRALQLTDNQGAPQEWCQLMMWIVSCSILLQVFARLDALLAQPPRLVTVGCSILQYVCLVVTYGCVIGIIVALYTMTPENAMHDDPTLPM
eukprot:gnl/TRDRNA2_/TRDRNA2_154612_c0_seq1.p1 gnl/TRDRNA2_/TRDRNA2_154612_c0~~gnl/TRDRNA2_/TRDRNA2_154612_c0_seq1.p1  ORF type:complete len:382 (+),score=60.72 gnl/TRDRNA2_/TRDRNA2_154612_c0_seq1:151-1146(+)